MQGNPGPIPSFSMLHAEKRTTLKSKKIGEPGDEATVISMHSQVPYNMHALLASDHLSSLDFYHLLATLVIRGQ